MTSKTLRNFKILECIVVAISFYEHAGHLLPKFSPFGDQVRVFWIGNEGSEPTDEEIKEIVHGRLCELFDLHDEDFDYYSPDQRGLDW